jgi:hypothetical protein
LARIEGEAFSKSPLKLIVIPRNVSFIHGSAFLNVRNVMVTIDPTNQHFVVCCGFILSFDQKTLVRYLGNDDSLVVPQNIEEIGRDCFCGCESVSSVAFANDPQLRRIESKAFALCRIAEMTIPKTVESIGPQSFCSQTLSSISFESDSVLRHIGAEAFSQSSIISIVIPRSVECLGQKCFASCGPLKSVAFEPNSLLEQIEPEAFAGTRLETIVIPRSVRVVGSKCLRRCQSLRSASFESDSQLERIESSAFMSCSSLTSIALPKSVEVVAVECFCRCRALSSVSFESRSQLRRIESKAFNETALCSVVLPSAIAFIAADAFEVSCVISTVDIDACPGFAEWNVRRLLGERSHFQQRPD